MPGQLDQIMGMLGGPGVGIGGGGSPVPGMPQGGGGMMPGLGGPRPQPPRATPASVPSFDQWLQQFGQINQITPEQRALLYPQYAEWAAAQQAQAQKEANEQNRESDPISQITKMLQLRELQNEMRRGPGRPNVSARGMG